MIDMKTVFPPFLKAGIKVLNQLSSGRFKKKRVYTTKNPMSVGEIKIEIAVKGDLQTRVVFDFPRTFAYRLAQAITGEIEENDNDLMESAILEVGNMISGNAMGFLEEIRLNCDILPPKAFVGKKNPFFMQEAFLGVIEFSSEIGEFNLYLVLEEKSSL